MESRQLSTVIAPSSHGFGSIDQTPSAPEWNLSSGTRQENRRPPMSPEEQLRWESESHKTIPGPEDLRLPHSCIGLQHQFTVPDNITVDDDSDDYLLVPEEKAGGGANDQDIDSMSDIYDDNFPSREDPGPELSNNSSEGSDFEHVEATYLNHNGKFIIHREPNFHSPLRRLA